MPSKRTRNEGAPSGSGVSIPPELLDRLVQGPMTPEEVQAICLDFKKALIERAMGAELSHHLGYRPGEARPDVIRRGTGVNIPRHRHEIPLERLQQPNDLAVRRVGGEARPKDTVTIHVRGKHGYRRTVIEDVCPFLSVDRQKILRHLFRNKRSALFACHACPLFFVLVFRVLDVLLLIQVSRHAGTQHSTQDVIRRHIKRHGAHEIVG